MVQNSKPVNAGAYTQQRDPRGDTTSNLPAEWRRSASPVPKADTDQRIFQTGLAPYIYLPPDASRFNSGTRRVLSSSGGHHSTGPKVVWHHENLTIASPRNPAQAMQFDTVQSRPGVDPALEAMLCDNGSWGNVNSGSSPVEGAVRNWGHLTASRNFENNILHGRGGWGTDEKVAYFKALEFKLGPGENGLLDALKVGLKTPVDVAQVPHSYGQRWAAAIPLKCPNGQTVPVTVMFGVWPSNQHPYVIGVTSRA
jgi:hypothetical protein